MKTLYFDFLWQKNFVADILIKYGVVRGHKNTVVLIKADDGETVYGEQLKYLKLARGIQHKYGYNVIVSTTPVDDYGCDQIDHALFLTEEYVEDIEDAYFFGNGTGAWEGAVRATKYPVFRHMILINPPVYKSPEQFAEGLRRFDGDKLICVFAEKDPSFAYMKNCELVGNPKVFCESVPDADHDFKGKLREFVDLYEKHFSDPEKVVQR
jgi:hypothetical protein